MLHMWAVGFNWDTCVSCGTSRHLWAAGFNWDTCISCGTSRHLWAVGFNWDTCVSCGTSRHLWAVGFNWDICVSCGTSRRLCMHQGISSYQNSLLRGDVMLHVYAPYVNAVLVILCTVHFCMFASKPCRYGCEEEKLAVAIWLITESQTHWWATKLSVFCIGFKSVNTWQAKLYEYSITIAMCDTIFWSMWLSIVMIMNK